MDATFRGRVSITVDGQVVTGAADLTCTADPDDTAAAERWQGGITVDRPELFDRQQVAITIGRRTAIGVIRGAVPGCDGHTLRIDGVGEPPF
jgi:hypothetical protein